MVNLILYTIYYAQLSTARTHLHTTELGFILLIKIQKTHTNEEHNDGRYDRHIEYINLYIKIIRVIEIYLVVCVCYPLLLFFSVWNNGINHGVKDSRMLVQYI